MKLMRQATLVMLLLVMRTGVAMAGETQIVLQWLDTAESVMDLLESLIKSFACQASQVFRPRFFPDRTRC
jgi:hypothetical protein